MAVSAFGITLYTRHANYVDYDRPACIRKEVFNSKGTETIGWASRWKSALASSLFVRSHCLLPTKVQTSPSGHSDAMSCSTPFPTSPVPPVARILYSSRGPMLQLEAAHLPLGHRNCSFRQPYIVSRSPLTSEAHNSPAG